MSSQAIVAAVRDALTQSTSVTALVSTRIFTAFRDTTTLPAIVLTTGQDANVSPTFGRTDCLRKFTVEVDCIASTLKVSRQIAEAVEKVTGAAGVAVVIEAKHMCMMMRGVEKQNSTMITSVMLGEFRSNAATRSEFLSLIK